jgi:hypothetical protein
MICGCIPSSMKPLDSFSSSPARIVTEVVLKWFKNFQKIMSALQIFKTTLPVTNLIILALCDVQQNLRSGVFNV